MEIELSSPKLKKLLIFQEGIFQARKIKKFTLKKFLIFFKKKSCYILGNGTL